MRKIDCEIEKTCLLSTYSKKSMPVEIVNDYPCSGCGYQEFRTKKKVLLYWVEVNHLLSESTTLYLCKNCDKVLIKVVHHTEE